MIVKIFKGVWFLSLLVTLAVFMYVYASLPEEIQVQAGQAVPALSISRDGLFYTTLTVLSFLNVLIIIFARLYRQNNEMLTAWFYGLVTFLHLFLIVALQFFNVYNSQENYDYTRLGVIIYSSIALVVIWSSLWPVYLVYARIFSKPTV